MCTLHKSLPANIKAGTGHLAVAKHTFYIVAMDHVSIDHRSIYRKSESYNSSGSVY